MRSSAICSRRRADGFRLGRGGRRRAARPRPWRPRSAPSPRPARRRGAACASAASPRPRVRRRRPPPARRGPSRRGRPACRRARPTACGRTARRTAMKAIATQLRGSAKKLSSCMRSALAQPRAARGQRRGHRAHPAARGSGAAPVSRAITVVAVSVATWRSAPSAAARAAAICASACAELLLQPLVQRRGLLRRGRLGLRPPRALIAACASARARWRGLGHFGRRRVRPAAFAPLARSPGRGRCALARSSSTDATCGSADSATAAGRARRR